MHFKDPERFKCWLTAVLVPVCEGEPGAWVKYIYALLKRYDGPINALRESLFSRFEELFENETEEFIALLVETLRNESYLVDDEPFYTANETLFGQRSRTIEHQFDETFNDHGEPKSRSRWLGRLGSPGDNDVKIARTVAEEDREREPRLSKRKCESISGSVGQNDDTKKTKFDDSQLEPQAPSNILHLKNVTKNFNNFDKLQASFKKFGKIVDIKMSRKKKKADIEFSAPHEAQQAYQNLEIVFGSLPIKAKLFCDNKEEVKSVEDKNTTQFQKPKSFSLDNRIASEMKLSNAKKADVIKKQEEAKKLAQYMAKKILDKQIEELNKLLKVEPNFKGEQKQQFMVTVNRLQTNIKNIQADLASTVGETVLPPVNVKVLKSPLLNIPTKKNKLLEAKQEILKNLQNIDLNLFIKQQQGYSDDKEILDLKKNVDTLRDELKAIGITPVSETAKPAIQMKEKLSNVTKVLEVVNKQHNTKTIILSSVDHRPTQLLVHGYKVDEENQVVMHFLQFGNIIEYISDTKYPALVIKYKNRKNAETAHRLGEVFQDRKLFITWYNLKHNFVDTSNVKAGPCMGNLAEPFDDK